jgi:hypothetical protein
MKQCPYKPHQSFQVSYHISDKSVLEKKMTLGDIRFYGRSLVNRNQILEEKMTLQATSVLWIGWVHFVNKSIFVFTTCKN